MPPHLRHAFSAEGVGAGASSPYSSDISLDTDQRSTSTRVFHSIHAPSFSLSSDVPFVFAAFALFFLPNLLPLPTVAAASRPTLVNADVYVFVVSFSDNEQDRLGFDKASKTLNWLLAQSKPPIDCLVDAADQVAVVTGGRPTLVTEADIEEFEAKYRGSDYEKTDLKDLYTKYKGNMNRINYLLYHIVKSETVLL
ncbi:Chaperone protein dnaJ 6 [Zea mays]|uniref:Chaperone protein dnaJ 6 n=1 Tax=Zea mays TaxID=4577 RepID=A0A1D6J6B6_MAIZE|nr:Chaperone protein dnaJ 6 [Zea mays]